MSRRNEAGACAWRPGVPFVPGGATLKLQPERSRRLERVFRNRNYLGLLLLAWLVPAALSWAQALAGAPPAPRPGERTGPRVCLSLSALAREANACRAARRTLPADLANLGGISWLEGLLADSESADVILVGRQVPKRPTLTLDDLVVNLRNVWNSQGPPSCSLDPQPEDIVRMRALLPAGGQPIQTEEQVQRLLNGLRRTWGGQRVLVGGVPRNSRHAHVMIDADYHMKRLSQGLVTLPGLASPLDRTLKDMVQAVRAGLPLPAAIPAMTRFWFHIGQGSPTFRESAGQSSGGNRRDSSPPLCLWIDTCPVVLLTERQLAAADGRLRDVGGENPAAQTFAAEFSAGYAKAAEAAPIYADLENLFRLSALLRALALKNANALATADLNFYLRECRYLRETPMPDVLPGLVNAKEAQTTVGTSQYTFMPIACGGVSMDMAVAPRQFRAATAGELAGLRAAVLRDRPARSAVSWTLRAP